MSAKYFAFKIVNDGFFMSIQREIDFLSKERQNDTNTFEYLYFNKHIVRNYSFIYCFAWIKEKISKLSNKQIYIFCAQCLYLLKLNIVCCLHWKGKSSFPVSLSHDLLFLLLLRFICCLISFQIVCNLHAAVSPVSRPRVSIPT